MKSKYFILFVIAIVANTNALATNYKVSIPLDTIPNSVEFNSLIQQGNNFQENGEWKKALKSYQKAINANPKSGKPYIKIGMLYWIANQDCDKFNRKLIAIESLRNFQIAQQFNDTKEEAKAEIEVFKKRLPTLEDIFIRALKKGKKYWQVAL